ncbi:MAG: ABC transporter substrate-binding protein, partial [Gemmatimonadota bacterium]|nr:ABC transporter substrate-binding protein [Gemmatimonadota bacterium]
MNGRNVRRSFPALVAAGLLWACGDGAGGGAPGDGAPEPAGDPVSGGAAVICAQGQPETLNPFVSPDQLSLDLAPLLFTPLVRVSPAYEIEPALAEAWSWEDDATRLVLRLRHDVTWHDGAPVTAEDVAFTLRTAADPDYGSFLAPDLETLAGAEAIDPVTVEVRFGEPFRAGLEPLAGLPVLPAGRLAGLGPEEFARAEYHREPVGSGPYRIASRGADGRLVFERAPDYPADLGPARLDRVLFRAIPEEATMAAELRSGGADACITGSAAAATIAGTRGVELEPLSPPSLFVVPLDTRVPALADPRVRRALSAALVREEIAAVISPLARPATRPLPPGSPWHDPAAAQPDADPALAARLFAEAGWTRDGADGPLRDAEGRPFRLTVTAPGAFETPLTAVQAQWRAAGVEAELRFMEWASYVQALMDPERRPEAMALSFVEDRVLRPDFSGTYASDSPR